MIPLALAFVGVCAVATAQSPATTVTIASGAPARTARVLERLGFERFAVHGVVKLRSPELLVELAPRSTAAGPLGTADRPLSIRVASVDDARRRLRGHRPAPRVLVAAPSGAESLRVEAPGDVVLILRAGADADPETVAVPTSGELNEIVLETLRAYPTDGTHTYYWPRRGSWKGCTKDLEYGGETLCEGDRRGRAFCCGLTFEVFLDAWRTWCQRNARRWRIKNLDLAGVRKLQSQWFGSAKDPSCLHTALVDNGLGTRVSDWADARPGDFVQLWRASGSGHSVVFLGWERHQKEIVGLRYWSTQRSTNGIGERTEWFGRRGGKQRLDPERIWICRVGVEP